MRAALLCIVSLSCAGCFVQGGARAGAVMSSDRSEATWGGQVAAGYEDGLLAAVELDARAVHGYGSAFGSGMQVGYTSGSLLSDVRLGVHGDAGLAFGFRTDTSFYAGGTVELPLRLSEPSPIAERNRNFRFIAGTPWLAPFLRYRFYRIGADAPLGRSLMQHDVSGGVLLRMSYASDLL